MYKNKLLFLDQRNENYSDTQRTTDTHVVMQRVQVTQHEEFEATGTIFYSEIETTNTQGNIII